MNTSDLEKYGLRGDGQMRADDFIHNGGWYNAKGEKIGWGDLSRGDLQRISMEIPEGDVFYVLSESDSFWNFVESNPGLTGEFCETAPTEKNPGLEYVRSKVMWVVVRGGNYSISKYNTQLGPRDYNGFPFTAVRSCDDINL